MIHMLTKKWRWILNDIHNGGVSYHLKFFCKYFTHFKIAYDFETSFFYVMKMKMWNTNGLPGGASFGFHQAARHIYQVFCLTFYRWEAVLLPILWQEVYEEWPPQQTRPPTPGVWPLRAAKVKAKEEQFKPLSWSHQGNGWRTIDISREDVKEIGQG